MSQNRNHLKVNSTQLSIGFCNYSPFDIETMLPPGFVRLLPTNQDEKYVIDYMQEGTGAVTSYNFYFASYSSLLRHDVVIADAVEGGHVAVLTAEKLANILGV